MKPGFWVSWRHLGSLKKTRFDTAEERALFVQTWLRDGKPALWETNSRGQRIIRMERNESTDPGQPGRMLCGAAGMPARWTTARGALTIGGQTLSCASQR